MSKLSYEDKVKIYQLRKQGETAINLFKKYNIRRENVNYMVRIIDRHGLDVLRKNVNKIYTRLEKETAVIRVINRESMCSVAVDIGLTSYSPLRKWIKNYKENGYNIVERKRGRLTMPKKPKKSKKNETIEEKVKRLEEENLYLKVELDYSKKLRAVVQARKNQQQKKK